MTTSPLRAERSSTDAAIAENVNTCLHRTRETASELARVLGMSKATLSRKMVGAGGWYYVEVAAIAEHFGVTPAELAGDLPPLDVWRACRDSNPKPSVLEFAAPRLRLIVNYGLTANRIPGGFRSEGTPAPVPTRLRAVS